MSPSSGSSGQLTRLLYDTWVDAGLLPPRVRQAVLTQAKQVTRAALARLGVDPEDCDDIEALFLAHQIQLASSNRPRVEALLQAYRQGTFTLSK